MPLGSSSSGAFQSLENYTCVLMAFWTLVPSRCPASGQLYAALEGPREIRVISISPGQWEDPIRCSLFHRELYEPHQGGSYRALSYAWGSIYTEETIYFQDIPKKVTLNLFCALRFLRQVDRASFLWVDALCINQQDNKERSRQVSLMRMIYEHAEEVIVFMGDGRSHRIQQADLTDPPTCPTMKLLGDYRDETFLASFLETCRSTEPKNFTSPATAALCAMSLVRLFSDEETTEHFCQELMKLGEATRRHLFESLRAFLISPWWRRIWVVQEIAVSKDAVIQFGTVSASWEVFVRSANVVSSIRRNSTTLAELEPENFKVLGLFETQLLTLERTRRRWHKDGGTNLCRLLQEFSNREASDDRDKVYGLLSLAKQEYNIRPDYQLNIFQTYMNTVLNLIKADASLACWAGDQKRKNHQGLPSWIPDWSNGLDPADRRRSAHAVAYNVNCGWTLQINQDKPDDLDTVNHQMELLINSLESRKKQLPISLRPFVERYAVECRKQIWERQKRAESMNQCLTQKMKTTMLGVYWTMDSTREKMEEEEENRERKMLEEIRRKIGVIRSIVYQCRRIASFYSSTNHELNPWELSKWSHASQARRYRKSTDRSEEVLELQTVPLERVEEVSTRMLGWSDRKTAVVTLMRWICLAGGLTRGGKTRRLDHDCLLNFARTIMGGISPRSRCYQDIDEDEFRPLMRWLQGLILQVKGVQHDESGRTFRIPVDFATSAFSHISDCGMLPSPFFESIELATDGRVFFVSETGVLGLGPASIQPGDTVHVLPSGPFHFVLRVDEDSWAELIGDCYLHTGDRLDDRDADEKEAGIEGSLPYEILQSIYMKGSFGKIKTVKLH